MQKVVVLQENVKGKKMGLLNIANWMKAAASASAMEKTWWGASEFSLEADGGSLVLMQVLVFVCNVLELLGHAVVTAAVSPRRAEPR